MYLAWRRIGLFFAAAVVSAVLLPPGRDAAGQTGDAIGGKAGEAIFRPPPPEPEELVQARRQVEQAHADAISRVKSRDDAARLVQQLLQQGRQAGGDAALRYALYDAARQVAERANHVGLALGAGDHLGESYDVDVFAIQESSLAACTKAVRNPADIPPLVEAALQIAEEAQAADDYAAAERLADMAMDVARRGRQQKLLARAAEQSRTAKLLATAYQSVRTASERLRTDPVDAASHSEVGRFLCLLKGDWERGLSHLARGDDEQLRALAEQDLTAPTDRLERLAIADGWLGQAARLKDSQRPQAQRRAAYWYRLAEDELKGFDRARVAKTLKSLPAVESMHRGSNRLQRLVAGEWKVSYDNGAVRTYRFDGLGSAYFIEEKLAGTLVLDGEHLKLDFRDGKLERLRFDNGHLLVEHFNPAAGYPDSPPLAGRGSLAP